MERVSVVVRAVAAVELWCVWLVSLPVTVAVPVVAFVVV